MKKTIQRNYTLDLLKAIACFMVIMLHFPAEKFSEDFTFLQTTLGRCGVPLFFMISGYLASCKDTAKLKGWFLKQAKKMLVYFLVFSVVIYLFYLVYDAVTNRAKPSISFDVNLQTILRLIFISEPFYSKYLWYFLAYAGTLFIYFIAAHFKYGYKVIACLAPVLLILYHVLGKYSLLLLGTNLPSNYSSNFLLAGLPMFTVGFYIKKIKLPAENKVNLIILTAASFMLLICEAKTFSVMRGYNARNNYIFNFVLAFFILKLALSSEKTVVSGENLLVKLGQKHSLYIYVFQYVSSTIWGYTLLKLAPKSVIFKFMLTFYQFGKPLFILLLALLISILACSIEKNVANIKTKINTNHKSKE